MKYPGPVKSTGYGTYQAIRPGVFELCWRPAGVKGPRLRRRVPCTLKEAKAHLKRESLNRDRTATGLHVAIEWEEALEVYRERAETDDLGATYIREVFRVLALLQEFAPRLDGITPLQIQQFLDTHAKRMKKAGRKGWASTANHYRNYLSGFFKTVFKLRNLPNPVTATFDYDAPKVPPHIIEPEEYGKVWRVSEPEVRDLLDWSLLTACRVSEMAGARHDKIVDGVWTCEDRKGNDYLQQQLPPVLLEIVARQKKMDDGLVFHKWVTRTGCDGGHGFNPGEPIDRDWWGEVVEHRCTKAGVRRFTPHKLRHAYSTWARRKGVPLHFIQEALGHSSITTTELYAHKDNLSGTKVAQLAILEIREKALQSLTA